MEHNGSCTLTKAECKALYEKMLKALDGELNQLEQHQVLHQIEAHPCCFEKMNIVKSYKAFLCNKLERKPVPTDLVNNIKYKVQQLSSQIN